MSDYDILLKLFDTLKDALKELQQLCHTMLSNQQNIGNYMKTLPMTDLKDALKDHNKETSNDIGTCKETVETTAGDILAAVTSISSRVNKMILVVIVAFTILTGGFFIIKAASDNTKDFSTWKQQYLQIEKETNEEQQVIMDQKLEVFMEEIIRKFEEHKNDPTQEKKLDKKLDDMMKILIKEMDKRHENDNR